MKDALGEELEEVPHHNSKYNLGYFEGRHQTKRWLSSKEDLMMMYRRYPSGSEVFLWCEGCADPLEDRLAEGQKSGNDSVVNKRQARDEEIDTNLRQLQETHDDTYSVPQLRLWARMVISGMHDDLDNPP